MKGLKKYFMARMTNKEMYLIWQLTPRRMLCGFRATKQEAAEYIVELQTKNKTAEFEMRKQVMGGNK